MLQCIEVDTILTTNEENLVFRSIGNSEKTKCAFSGIKRIPVITTKMIVQNDGYSLNTVPEKIFRKCSKFNFSIEKSIKIGGFGLRLNSSSPSDLPENGCIKLMNDYD